MLKATKNQNKRESLPSSNYIPNKWSKFFIVMQSINSFSYSTLPHAAPLKRKTKYRDDNDISVDPALTNLMHDPRVVRGNTFSAKTLSLSQIGETPIAKKVSRADAQRRKFTTKRSSTPPAVAGRIHMDIQTDQFLEELSDRPVEVDAETQTQAFMDRPASPLFVPARTGHDVVTQILPGDLWDFDVEVEPILEVLVGKTLHVAMLEVMQEEELDAIYRQQEEYELIRKIELAEVQRLEAAAKRKMLEKERRIEQEVFRAAQQKLLEEKVAAQFFAQQYLGSLHSGVFDMLEDQGFFYDPLQKEIEETTMVDLLADLKLKSNCYEIAQNMLDELISGAGQKAAEYEKITAALRLKAAEKLQADADAALKEKEQQESLMKEHIIEEIVDDRERNIEEAAEEAEEEESEE